MPGPAAKRALLADIIASNRSVFEPGLNPDMDPAERDFFLKYIEALEEWNADLGRAGPLPAVDELEWRAGVLDSEIKSWKGIVKSDPTLSPGEQSDFMDTVAELEWWMAELKAQAVAGKRSRGTTAKGCRRR
ncbi:MAG: hypothetical protein FJ149_06255 [Euryarchaeota archaeon]|nr:hypothetical protein [Euryarchaeota archaeon]